MDQGTVDEATVDEATVDEATVDEAPVDEAPAALRRRTGRGARTLGGPLVTRTLD